MHFSCLSSHLVSSLVLPLPAPNKKLETDSSDSVQVAKPKSVEPELAAEDLETKAQGGGEVEPRKNDEPQASSKSDNESIGDKPKSVEPELPEAEESESESKRGN